MKLLSTLKNYIHRSIHSELDDYWYMPIAGPSISGIDVDQSKALTYTTVWACVRLISETIASLPLHVYKRLADGGKDKMPEHPMYELLHTQPNREMTAFQYREQGMSSLLLWGNWYSLIVRDRMGAIQELWPLNPANMEVERLDDPDRGPLRYRYKMSKSGEEIIFLPEEILHIAGLGFNGLVGYSPISMAREAIGLGLASEELAARFFSNDATPGGVLQHPMKLSPQAHDNLKKSLTERHGGLPNKWLPMILEEGMTWKETTMPFKDAQFIEIRKFQRDEICSFFLVPPPMVGSLERANFSNVEQLTLNLVVHTIRPWLVRLEQGYQMKLFGDNKRIKYFAEHSVDGLLRGDSQARSAYYNAMFQIGAYSPNDIRELENRNPIKDGDKHYIQLNMWELGSERPKPTTPNSIEPTPPKPTEEEEMSEEEKKELKQLRLDSPELRTKNEGLTFENLRLNSEKSSFSEKIAQKDEIIKRISEEGQNEIQRLNQVIVDKNIEIQRLKDDRHYRRLFDDAISRIIRRESIAVKRALQRKDLNGFNAYMDDFYKDLPEFANSTLHPSIMSFAQMQNSTGALNCIKEYVPRHINESKTEINSWVGVYLHDTTDFRKDEKAIDDCLDIWMEKRTEKATDGFIGFFATT